MTVAYNETSYGYESTPYWNGASIAGYNDAQLYNSNQRLYDGDLIEGLGIGAPVGIVLDTAAAATSQRAGAVGLIELALDAYADGAQIVVTTGIGATTLELLALASGKRYIAPGAGPAQLALRVAGTGNGKHTSTASAVLSLGAAAVGGRKVVRSASTTMALVPSVSAQRPAAYGLVSVGDQASAQLMIGDDLA